MRPAAHLWVLWLGTLAACGESAETLPEAAPPAKRAPVAAQPAATVPTSAFAKAAVAAAAPRRGDGVAWGTRMAPGIEALYRSAIQGKGAMPAKGGNPALSNAAVRAAVDHLLAQSR